MDIYQCGGGIVPYMFTLNIYKTPYKSSTERIEGQNNHLKVLEIRVKSKMSFHKNVCFGVNIQKNILQVEI